jgi:hypothetical protein
MDRISGIGGAGGPESLTPAEKAEVARLAARDREVRAHEANHLAAAGALAAGGAEYVYEIGPDGKAYAVGGQVKICVTSGPTPEDTLAKARQLRAAANSPMDPSGQDSAVAAQASRMEAEAQRELAGQRNQERQAFIGPQPGFSSRRLDQTA